MGYQRRSLLKLSGTAIASAAAVGATAPTSSAAPAVRWEPAAPSNYRDANRTTADIDWIILHTIQGSYQAGINTFKNPAENVSAHYVVGEQPGQLTSMVRNRDIAWTAGDAGYNARGINIELSGYSSTGFPDQQYENLAELVEFLCEEYGIPKRGPDFRVAPCNAAAGSGGIIGHVHIPGRNCNGRGGAGGHTDPGPHFDYDRLVEAVRADPKPAFEVGDTVEAGRDLNARAEPEIGFNVIHTNPKGTTGTIVDGHELAENYLWWEIEWDNGITGWAIQQYLEASSGDPPDGGRDDEIPGGGNDDDRSGDRDDDDGSDDDDSRDDGDSEDRRFRIGETVASTVDLNTRWKPTLDAWIRETVSTGTTGQVQDNPVTADGYTWWQIEWEDGTKGWSVEQYLEEADPGGSAETEDVEGMFGIDEEVMSTVDLNTRNEPSLDSRVLQTVDPGTVGWVQDGVVTADGYVWWQIEWETGTTGWSVETYLEESDGLAWLFGL
jgi:N-acetyl-anhydromuramyl-L-alanine amidase AmpD/uncharacterized protein YgiM (DUF1202 family)